MRTTLRLTIAAFVVAALNLSAATLHVSLLSTNPVAPYATWETAATVIQDAVDAAREGDTVLVTNGVYAVGEREVSVLDTNTEPPQSVSQGWSRVVVTNVIRLQSVNGPSATTIDGGGSVRCVYLGTNAVLSGFTLTGGYVSSRGGGVWSVPDGVITNCVLGTNRVSRAFGGTSGGGAFGGMLYDCLILNNSSSGGTGWGLPGGGSGDGACGSTLHNCTVSGNYASGWPGGGRGGGVANCALRNCTLTANQCALGGGASGSTLYGCTVIGNEGSFRGGGVYESTLYNCALTGNTGYGADRSALYSCTVTGNDFGVDGIAVNSIVWGNTNGNYDQGTFDHCVTSPVPVDGLGNLDADPRFVDPANGDFRLRPDSPGIDTGTNLLGRSMMAWRWLEGNPNYDWIVVGSITDPTDILGNTRFIDGDSKGGVAWDIGAYEFNSSKPPRFTVHPELTSEGWRLNITGAPGRPARLQRSRNLQDWQDVWSGQIGMEGVLQVNDRLSVDEGQPVMFYRVVVP